MSSPLRYCALHLHEHFICKEFCLFYRQHLYSKGMGNKCSRGHCSHDFQGRLIIYQLLLTLTYSAVPYTQQTHSHSIWNPKSYVPISDKFNVHRIPFDQHHTHSIFQELQALMIRYNHLSAHTDHKYSKVSNYVFK